MTPLRAVALLFTNIALVQAQKTGLTSSGGTDALSIQDGLPRSSTSELSLFASVSETVSILYTASPQGIITSMLASQQSAIISRLTH